jgi:ribosome maturation factor RimP
MEIEEEIRKIAEERLVGPDKFIVEVIVSSRKAPQKVTVIVDGDVGVNIDDCATISRELSKALDDLALLDERYVLEVSTPGLDQPLKFKRQYKKNIGRRLKVKFLDRVAQGKLLDADDEKITVAEETGVGKKKTIVPIQIHFSEIDKSFVLVSFK